MKPTSRLPKPAMILAGIILLSAGCMTPKKIDRWASQHYATAITPPRKTDYITIKDASFVQGDSPSTTEKKKGKMLPLLFYWKWKLGTHTELQQNVPATVFASAMIPYANSKRLKQKLDGQRIEITIDEVPSGFSIMDEGWLVFLIFGSVHNEVMYIDPDVKNMAVSYRVMKDNVETRIGKVSVADLNKAVDFRMFKSAKKTFFEYLDKYNSNIQMMAKETVDKIMADMAL
ncbi:MAG: hypothetical protein DI535_25705 [Citrobacter freundii]|nr:MAG: hypothetical protein DI535_25705 [Citrobacter freundii]